MEFIPQSKVFYLLFSLFLGTSAAKILLSELGSILSKSQVAEDERFYYYKLFSSLFTLTS